MLGPQAQNSGFIDLGAARASGAVDATSGVSSVQHHLLRQHMSMSASSVSEETEVCLELSATDYPFVCPEITLDVPPFLPVLHFHSYSQALHTITPFRPLPSYHPF